MSTFQSAKVVPQCLQLTVPRIRVHLHVLLSKCERTCRPASVTLRTCLLPWDGSVALWYSLQIQEHVFCSEEARSEESSAYTSTLRLAIPHEQLALSVDTK